ncbi:MAG: class I SAM-dependent methyltransferase [Pirellulales bacterium]
MQLPYRDDLAYIHDAGFGHLASAAATMLVDCLRRQGVTSGTVVELGCGSGISARTLVDAGYAVMGVDLSESLIELARRRVPEATFVAKSFSEAEIPPCVAVTAIGEVLSYRFDSTNCAATRADLFQRIYSALMPGGIFLFDMAGPVRAPVGGRQQAFVEGSDWVVLMEAESNAARTLLTRRITTFRRTGDCYRRDNEVHQLELAEPADVIDSLGQVGFAVDTLSQYGSCTLPPGLVGCLARKR